MNLTEARELALNLMDKFILSKREMWNFDYQGGTNRCGRCHWNGTKLLGATGGGKIYLTTDYVLAAGIEEVTKTILHEIAHAIAGPEAGHNYRWQRICLQIGGNGKRLADKNEGTGVQTLIELSKVWKGTCTRPECDFKVYRARLTARAKRGFCPRCFNKAQREGDTSTAKIVWRKNL